MIDLEHVFAYHPPTPDQIPKYNRLRAAAKEFAALVVDLTPPGPDQAAAVRKVREAVMTANAAIALRGRLERVPPLPTDVL
jgi:hypothetical protein